MSDVKSKPLNKLHGLMDCDAVMVDDLSSSKQKEVMERYLHERALQREREQEESYRVRKRRLTP